MGEYLTTDLKKTVLSGNDKKTFESFINYYKENQDESLLDYYFDAEGIELLSSSQGLSEKLTSIFQNLPTIVTETIFTSDKIFLSLRKMNSSKLREDRSSILGISSEILDILHPGVEDFLAFCIFLTSLKAESFDETKRQMFSNIIQRWLCTLLETITNFSDIDYLKELSDYIDTLEKEQAPTIKHAIFNRYFMEIDRLQKTEDIRIKEFRLSETNKAISFLVFCIDMNPDSIYRIFALDDESLVLLVTSNNLTLPKDHSFINRLTNRLINLPSEDYYSIKSKLQSNPNGSDMLFDDIETKRRAKHQKYKTSDLQKISNDQLFSLFFETLLGVKYKDAETSLKTMEISTFLDILSPDELKIYQLMLEVISSKTEMDLELNPPIELRLRSSDLPFNSTHNYKSSSFFDNDFLPGSIPKYDHAAAKRRTEDIETKYKKKLLPIVKTVLEHNTDYIEVLYDSFIKLRTASHTNIMNSLYRVEKENHPEGVRIIEFDGIPFNMLVRRNSKKRNVEEITEADLVPFSIINEKNVSTYEGDYSLPTLYGYNPLPPKNIIFVSPVDCQSELTENRNYSEHDNGYLSHLVDIDTLNQRTLEEDTFFQYNEIDILAEPKNGKGILPDFVVSIDEPSSQEKQDAERLDIPIVKVKRISYTSQVYKIGDAHMTQMTGE